MTIGTFTFTSFAQMLAAMDGWLDKARAYAATLGDDDHALLSHRLASDMFPLASQVRFACIHAGETITRLRNEPTAPEVEAVRREALSGRERPGTVDGAKARVEQTRVALDRTKADQPGDIASRTIRFSLPGGMAFELSGEEYVRDWALPQFYFHLNTTYAILRAYGVKLGKADYVGHMVPHIGRS